MTIDQATIVAQTPEAPTETRTAKFKRAVDIAQSLVTIAALLIGGWWTYRLFVEKREIQPHLNIHHKMVSKVISPNTVWLQLKVSLENTGESRVSLRDSDIRILQILPLDPSLKRLVDAGKNPVSPKDNRIPWPYLSHYVAKLGLDIEPNETDNLDFDFVLPADIKTIRVYTYFKNAAESSNAQPIGWNLGSIYDIGSEASFSDKSSDLSASRVGSSTSKQP